MGGKSRNAKRERDAALARQPAAPRVEPPLSSPAAAPKETWRKNVMVVILNERREMLLFMRPIREGWQCIQGGIDDGEDLAEAGMREAYEEAGLICDGFDYVACERYATPKYGKRGPRTEQELLENPIPALTVDYHLTVVGELPLPPEDGPLRYRFPAGKCLKWVAQGIIGQEQRCLVMATSGGDRMRHRIDLRGKALQPREFIDVTWFPATNSDGLARIVASQKLDVFKRVSARLTDVLAEDAVTSPDTDVAAFARTLRKKLQPQTQA